MTTSAAFARVRAALGVHPLAWPIAPLFARFLGDPLADVAEVDRALGALAGVRFERAVPRPSRARRRSPFVPALGYDGRITLESVVLTREGSVHDLVNALVWAVMPRAKRAVHGRQHASIARRGGPAKARSREEDALALVDEGGAVVVVTQGSFEAASACVRDEDPRALRRLCAGGGARAVLFGHALYEHLAAGQDSVRAAVPLVVSATPGQDLVEVAEGALAAMLEDPSALLDPAALARAPLDALAGRSEAW